MLRMHSSLAWPAALLLAFELSAQLLLHGAQSRGAAGVCASVLRARAGAEPERVKREVEEVVGLDCSGAILASAKQGVGIAEILEAVVARIPPPPDTTHLPLRALIFDSYYDPYKVCLWL